MRAGLLRCALLGLLAGTGCWQRPLDDEFTRVDQMINHEVELASARDAILANDLQGAREAADRLRQRTWVPGLGVQPLESMRTSADRLAEAKTIEAAADRLVDVTAHCASCHHAHERTAVEPFGDQTVDLLWMGLVFESDPHWARGIQGADPALDTAGWPGRRRAMAALLAQGAHAPDGL